MLTKHMHPCGQGKVIFLNSIININNLSIKTQKEGKCTYGNAVKSLLLLEPMFTDISYCTHMSLLLVCLSGLVCFESILENTKNDENC